MSLQDLKQAAMPNRSCCSCTTSAAACISLTKMAFFFAVPSAESSKSRVRPSPDLRRVRPPTAPNCPVGCMTGKTQAMSPTSPPTHSTRSAPSRDPHLTNEGGGSCGRRSATQNSWANASTSIQRHTWSRLTQPTEAKSSIWHRCWLSDSSDVSRRSLGRVRPRRGAVGPAVPSLEGRAT